MTSLFVWFEVSALFSQSKVIRPALNNGQVLHPFPVTSHQHHTHTHTCARAHTRTHSHKHPFPFHQHTSSCAVPLLLLLRALFTPWTMSFVLSDSTLTPSVFSRVKLKSIKLVFSSFWWNFAALKAGPCSFRWHWRILQSRWSSGVAWWARNNPHCSGRTLGAPPVWSERAVGLLIHGQEKTHTQTGGLLVTALIITVSMPGLSYSGCGGNKWQPSTLDNGHVCTCRNLVKH